MSAALSMTTLADFQGAFARALLAPGAAAAAVAPLTAQPGFAVYRNTVMKGCIDALQANFPAVARLVGDEWFRAAAAVYVRGELPGEPMLALYGAGFADFLARFEPAAELPYLPAVARIDRLWSEAHVAADAAPLTAAALLTLTPAEVARCTLPLHPAARWAWSEEFPIHALWSRNRAEAPAEDVPPAWQGEGVLLTRPHGAVRAEPLSRAGAVLLGACAAGRSIEDAVAAALAAEPAVDIAALIGQCVAAGAFCDVVPLREDNGKRSL